MRLFAILALCLCADAATLVIRDVTVIDGTGAPPRGGVNVVITGNRITAVGRRVSIPKRVRVVNGTGKFLIPGLWDMHVHLREKDVPLYLANGITGVRDMGSDFERTVACRKAVQSGRLPGPLIVTSGPAAGGPGDRSGEFPIVRVSTPREAYQAADQLDRRGSDFLNVLPGLPRDAYFAFAQRARELRTAFAGPVPDSVSVEESIDARQRSIEHLSGILRADESYDEAQAGDLFRRMARFSVWQVPTLSALARPDLECLPEKQRPPFETSMRAVRDMQKAGVGLLTGTDAGCEGIPPGAALHGELELLVTAGLTPLEAIQTATLNPARYFGRETDFGTVARGKLANLVLLQADPMRDIRNSRRTDAVIFNGKFLDRKTLDALLVRGGGREASATVPSAGRVEAPAKKHE
ncbi:MAG: amidohydrolase family protein [Acidobacteria bacterium]|nr:amidohydrolase family protein [Acidobacteriota bacterium]